MKLPSKTVLSHNVEMVQNIEIKLVTKVVSSAFLCRYALARRTSSFFMLQANFVKINLRHAVIVLMLDMHTDIFVTKKRLVVSSVIDVCNGGLPTRSTRATAQ